MAEALPRLHEVAVEAEKALRIAQERVRAATGRQPKCPAFVEVHGDHLVVNMKTRDKNFMLLSFIRIPLEHVVGAEADSYVEWEVWRGWRVPGVSVPGVRFYAVRGRRDKMLVIQLKDETYERLITEVEDLGEVAENINEPLLGNRVNSGNPLPIEGACDAQYTTAPLAIMPRDRAVVG